MLGFNLEKEYNALRVQYDQLFDQGSAAIAENVDLRRQLAAANEKLSESARLATESAQIADGLARDLAAANERAGRLEAQMVELREGWPSFEYVDDTEGMVAVEVPEVVIQNFHRILGGA